MLTDALDRGHRDRRVGSVDQWRRFRLREQFAPRLRRPAFLRNGELVLRKAAFDGKSSIVPAGTGMPFSVIFPALRTGLLSLKSLRAVSDFVR
jgi:hypothetical protein